MDEPNLGWDPSRWTVPLKDFLYRIAQLLNCSTTVLQRRRSPCFQSVMGQFSSLLLLSQNNKPTPSLSGWEGGPTHHIYISMVSVSLQPRGGGGGKKPRQDSNVKAEAARREEI
jgi:hypothetical protein